MKKINLDSERYFFVTPDKFYRYGELNIDGEYERVKLDNFCITGEPQLNDKFNYIMIKVPTEQTEFGERKCANEGTELFTGAKFSVYEDINKIKFISSDGSLFMRDFTDYYETLADKRIVSGRIKYLMDNPELLDSYCAQLGAAIEVADHYKEELDRTWNGPDKHTTRIIRRAFKRR